MKLFLRPGACSLTVHIVLREIGAVFETAEVDLATKRLVDGGDYLAVNPKGQVPALLLDDGKLLTEGPAINQYLADLEPGAGMLPAIGDPLRYDALTWLNFVATELHKTVSPLMRPTTPADYRGVVTAEFERKLAIVERHLSGKEYLTDAGFTIADAYMYVVTGWLPRIGVDTAPYPAIAAFRGRVTARPAVAAALAAEGL